MKLNSKDVIDLMDESDVFINPKSKHKINESDLSNLSNRMQHIRTKHVNKHEDSKLYGQKDRRYK